MKPTVIITYADAASTKVEQEVLSAIDPTILYIRDLNSEEGQEAVAKADALIVALEEVRADLIAKMSRCQVISRLGTGVDSIDVAAATEHNIWVTYVPDYSMDEVSAHAIALMMTLARRVPPLIALTRQGIWDAKRVWPIQRLSDQTLGVLGFGRIGRETVRKGLGLGLKVLVHDPYVDAQTIEASGAGAADWETLLSTSDYVSLHTPLTEATHHLIDDQALSLMKPTAFLINTARGPLIDEAALLRAVRSEQIAGAALDVLSVEPPPADHPLLHEERIIVTPHIAFYSEASRRELHMRGAEEVVRVLSGKSPRSPVNQIK